MDHWSVKFKARLEKLGIKLWLLSKYVDNVLVVVSNQPIGARGVKDRVVVTPEG